MDWTIFARYVAPILALFVGAWLNRRLERRPNLTAYLSHAGAVQVRPENQPSFSVHTHTVVIRNSGKLKASNVRLGHNVLPSFSVFPNVQHEVANLPGAGSEIVFSALVPDEQVTITYLYFPPLVFPQINTTVKADEGFAQIQQVLPTPQRPKWQTQLATVLVIVGAATVVYAVVELARYAMRVAAVTQ